MAGFENTSWDAIDKLGGAGYDRNKLAETIRKYGGFEQTPWKEIDAAMGSGYDRNAFAALMRADANLSPAPAPASPALPAPEAQPLPPPPSVPTPSLIASPEVDRYRPVTPPPPTELGDAMQPMTGAPSPSPLAQSEGARFRPISPEAPPQAPIASPFASSPPAATAPDLPPVTAGPGPKLLSEGGALAGVGDPNPHPKPTAPVTPTLPAPDTTDGFKPTLPKPVAPATPPIAPVTTTALPTPGEAPHPTPSAPGAPPVTTAPKPVTPAAPVVPPVTSPLPPVVPHPEIKPNTTQVDSKTGINPWTRNRPPIDPGAPDFSTNLRGDVYAPGGDPRLKAAQDQTDEQANRAINATDWRHLSEGGTDRYRNIFGTGEVASSDIMGAPNRTELAKKALADFQQQGEKDLAARYRTVGQQASKFGQIGLGDVNARLGTIAGDYETRRLQKENELAQSVAEGDIEDRFRTRDYNTNLGVGNANRVFERADTAAGYGGREATKALADRATRLGQAQTLEDQISGQGASNREEMRGERGYQARTAQTSLDNRIRERGLQNSEREQRTARAIALMQASGGTLTLEQALAELGG